MASTHKHIRSSTANKRPTTAIADGQIALNTNASSPGLFFKDSTGASIIKIGPVHVGSTAPNVTPASGGSSGNSTGEIWLDNSLTPVGVKIWDGSAWVNATPAGSTTVQGLLELATNAETQTGSDTARAVTPASLQSKLSDSTSTTSSTTIASSTAVKSAYDLAAAALPLSGGTITGNLEIGTTGSLSFEGSTADAFETTIAVTDPTADRTITLPDTTGTVVTTGDSGTVTSTMIADGTIVNADVNASAAIAGTKISPDFGSQNTTTTGTSTAASFIPTSSTVPTNGVYLPAANSVAISTNGSGRLFVDASGNVGIGTTPTVRLHVSATDGTIYQQATRGTGTTWRLQTSGANGQAYELYDITNSQRAYLYTGGTGGSWQFSTEGTERLRITSAGLVGIGTTSPSFLVDCIGSSTPTLRIDDGAASGTRTAGRLLLGASTTLGVAIENSVSSFNDVCSMVFKTTPAAGTITERARIDSSGRLLVGTSSSSGIDSSLQVVSNTGVTIHRGINSTSASLLTFSKSRNTTYGSNTIVQNNDVIGLIGFRADDGTDYLTPAAQITAEVDGTPGANDMPGRLVFSTTADGASSPTEGLRIDSSQVVWLSNTFLNAASFATSGKTRISNAASTNTGAVGMESYGSTTATRHHISFSNPNGVVGSISTNASATAYNTSSDYRLKENVTPVTDGITRLQQLKPSRFNFIADPDKTVDGFIAHEVQAVVPEAITGEKDAVDDDGNPVYQGIDQSKLVPLLTAALQEAVSKIESLEARLTAAGI